MEGQNSLMNDDSTDRDSMGGMKNQDEDLYG